MPHVARARSIVITIVSTSHLACTHLQYYYHYIPAVLHKSLLVQAGCSSSRSSHHFELAPRGLASIDFLHTRDFAHQNIHERGMDADDEHTRGLKGCKDGLILCDFGLNLVACARDKLLCWS